jgi:hypothetical protein
MAWALWLDLMGIDLMHLLLHLGLDDGMTKVSWANKLEMHSLADIG